MATNRHSTVGIDPAKVGGIDRFVIVNDGNTVVEKRGNGTSYYMTYKTIQAAERGWQRARFTYPDAFIFDKQADKFNQSMQLPVATGDAFESEEPPG
jgi:hypothetical protein